MNVGELETFYKSCNDVKNKYIEYVDSDKFNNEKDNRYINESIKGKIGLMCPKCFNILKRNISIKYEIIIDTTKPNIDDNLYTITDTACMFKKCNVCESKNIKLIVLDESISDAISILNKLGYKTKYSCSGHEDYNTTGYILFENDSILKVIHTLPITWTLDLDDIRKFNQICIRSYAESYYESILDLNEWVKSLPKNS